MIFYLWMLDINSPDVLLFEEVESNDLAFLLDLFLFFESLSDLLE